MKNATLRVLRVLAIGVLCSLLGHFLAGCDGGGTEASDAGSAGVLAPRPDGAVSCAIPSPTGDQPSGYGAAARDLPATNFLFVANDVAAACEGSKKPVCVTNPATGVVTCTTPVATQGLACDDPAHDFQGSTGEPWCVALTTPDGSSACNATYLSGSCIAQGVSPMSKYATGPVQGRLVRSWALCGASGKFVGWMCTAS